LRTARVFERWRCVRERDVDAVCEGGGPVERELTADPRAAIELDATHARLLCVGQVAAQHADARVHDLGLEVLDLSVVSREVGGHASERPGLHANFDM